jgi:hypothetical protein
LSGQSNSEIQHAPAPVEQWKRSTVTGSDRRHNFGHKRYIARFWPDLDTVFLYGASFSFLTMDLLSLAPGKNYPARAINWFD